MISRWTAEVNATRAAAEAQRRGAGRPTGRMSEDEIRNLVEALGSILRVLRDADPADKACIYTELGLRLTYQPGRKTVIAEATAPAIMYKTECPRGDLNPHALSGTSTSS